jgi:hypothetical protein
MSAGGAPSNRVRRRRQKHPQRPAGPHGAGCFSPPGARSTRSCEAGALRLTGSNVRVFLSLLPPVRAARRLCAAGGDRRAGEECRPGARPHRPRRQGRRCAAVVPGAVPVGLCDRRSLVSRCVARRRREPGRPPGRGQRQALAGVRRRRAAALARPSLQLRHGRPPRASTRRGAEGVPAELPRILRAAPFHLGRGRARRHDRGRRARGALRHRPHFRRGRPRRVHLSRRDLRGSVGAAAAERHRCRRRRRGAAKPVGQQYRHRQGADAAPLMRLAIGALHRRVCLFRRRRRRIDDRPRVGRPGRDLRDRRTIGRDRAVQRPARDRDRRHRSRPHSPGTDAHQHLRGLRPATRRNGAAVPPDRVRFCRAGGAAGAAPDGRTLPFRAGRPGDARRQLLRSLQHPGPGAGAAPPGDRPPEAGDRRVRRARFDPGADRRLPRRRPARPAARQRPRLHAASPPAARPRPTPGG